MKTRHEKTTPGSGIAKRALIIEKEKKHRQAFQALLEAHGWDIQFAETIEDARASFKEEPPYLHFIDTCFNEKEIKEYIERLAVEDAAHTVLITWDEYSQDKARALLQHGVYDFVKKPFAAEEVIPLLERCYERAFLHKQNAEKKAEATALEHAIASIVFSTKRISKNLLIDEFCKALMHEFALLLEATGGSFFMAEDNKLIRVYSLDPGHAPDEISMPPREESFLGIAFKTGKSILASNMDEEKIASSSGFDGYKDQSCLIIPLFNNGEDLIAFVSLHNKKDTAFTQRDKTIGQALAGASTGILRTLKSLEKTKESESRYQRFFKESFSANVIATEGGEILLANPAFYKIFHLSPDTRNPISITRLFRDKKEWGVLVRRLQIEKKIENVEIELIAADNSRVTVFGNLIANFDRKGMLRSIDSCFFDITQKIELERELNHSLKMEAIGRLAGGVAHDFNNLITAILGYCEVIQDRILETDVREEIDEIRRVGEKASELTQQLLYFARKVPQEPALINLSEVVRDLERMLNRLIGEDIKLYIETKARKPIVFAERGKIDQVIMNLVVNARDALSEGGTISIIIEERDCAYPAQQTAGKSEKWVALSVSDTGKGMDVETQRRIFEPFFSTKLKGKGTGLGLSTVYTIVTQAGGFIDVKSSPGKGSTFTLFFPKGEDETKKAPVENENGAPCRGSENIIVIDDEKIVRSVIARVLQKHGYKVAECASGREAIELAAQSSVPFDLALIDIIMPSMSGIQLATELRKINPSLKVLFMSGYTNNELERYSPDQAEEKDLIAKPFHQEVLAKKVREILDRPR